MRKKQEEFYNFYHKLGRTEEAAEVALGKIYSIKTWSKTKKQKQLDKLLCSDEGKLHLENLDKTKKVRKKLDKTSGDLDKSLEKTANNEVEKKNLGKKKSGFASGYTKQADSVARELFALGAHDLDVQKALKISPATYYRWKIDNPSFLSAKLEGQDFYTVEQVEGNIAKKANGFYYLKEVIEEKDGDGNVIRTVTKRKQMPPDTPAGKYVMSNLSPERYQERPEPRIPGQGKDDGEMRKLTEQEGAQRANAEKLHEALSDDNLSEE